MSRNLFLALPATLVGLLVLAACAAPTPGASEPAIPPTSEQSTATATVPATATSAPSPEPDTEYEIVTLLSRDAIPAIFEPEFLTTAEANEEYSDNELVIGVEIDGDARAYSIPYLSSREIVNDNVSGKPIAVTW